jgi:hypothetical protein
VRLFLAFKHSWRIRGSILAYSKNTRKVLYLSVLREYYEFRIVYGTQNRLLTCGKYINVFGEYTESI